MDMFHNLARAILVILGITANLVEK